MKKILLLLILIIPLNICALEIPETHSSKVLIYDITDNKYIIEKDIEKTTDIASITKILTVITAIESVDNIDRYVTVTEDMYYGLDPELTVAGIKVGDTVKIKDLLYAAILPSGADACYILANTISGSENEFVKRMNEKAKEIGMENSEFANVTGLDADSHYSTAEDIKKLIEYSIKNEVFRHVFAARKYQLSNGLEVEASALSFGDYVGLDVTRLTGGKTGFTDLAGLCFAGTFNSDNHDFIIVVLNAPAEVRKAYHIVDVIKLINFVDNNYNHEVLFKKEDIVKQIKVKLSKIDSYDIKIKEDITKYLPIDYDKSKIRYEYDGIDEISFLTKQNKKLGHIKYLYEDELLYEEDIFLEEKINISIKKVIVEYKAFIIGFIGGLVLALIVKKKTKKRKKV